MNLPLTALKNGETGVITSTDFNSEHRGMCGHRAGRGRWRKHEEDVGESISWSLVSPKDSAT